MPTNITQPEPEQIVTFTVPIKALLRYLETCGLCCPLPGNIAEGDSACSAPPVDWHLVLRHGLGHRLHVNLGIPGLEEPAHPIEENAAALYAAIAMGESTIDLILSGELEQAVEAGLITEQALADLRNQIRISN